MDNLSKFIGKPQVFTGEEGGIQATTWLKSLDRIKKALNFNYEKMLLIAATHLSSSALLWQENHEDAVSEWRSFEKIFKQQFIYGSNQEKHWNYLEELQQGDITVEKLGFKLQGLFKLTNLTDERMKTRFLLKALKAEISLEVEKASLPKNFKDTLDYAIKMERLERKYGSIGSQGSTSTMANIVDRMEKLEINVVKQNNNRNNNNKNITCFNCKQTGHYASNYKSNNNRKSNNNNDSNRNNNNANNNGNKTNNVSVDSGNGSDHQ